VVILTFMSLDTSREISCKVRTQDSCAQLTGNVTLLLLGSGVLTRCDHCKILWPISTICHSSTSCADVHDILISVLNGFGYLTHVSQPCLLIVPPFTCHRQLCTLGTKQDCPRNCLHCLARKYCLLCLRSVSISFCVTLNLLNHSRNINIPGAIRG